MKKSIKLITLILMSLAFSVAANAETNEKCGENISWEICDDGKLIISGTGDMYDTALSVF